MKTLLIVAIAFAISYILVIGIPQVHVKEILEKVVFSTISVLVGASVAVTGIFLGSLNTIATNIFDSNSFSDEEKEGLSEIMNNVNSDLKENTLFSIISLLGSVFLYAYKFIDIPNVVWPFQSSFLNKYTIIDTLIFTLMILIFYAVFVSVTAIFKMTAGFMLIKKREN